MSKSISLSASTRVSRRAKDGEAGVGISKADVLFCVSTSNTTIPADFAAWKSTVSDIGSGTMTLSSYLWTCTKITYTNNTTALVGKYCLGACKDMATATEQYVLSTSNTTPPTTGWAETYTATKGYYLWTRNKLMMQNGDLRYTDAICVGYLGKDGTNGTSFTVRGKAKSHYTSYTEWKTAETKLTLSKSPVLIDYDDYNVIGTPCVLTYKSTAKDGASSAAAATGDAYTIGTEEWVSNGSKWVDVGNIQGPSGDDGEDTLRVEFTPDTLNFVYTYKNNDNVVTVNVKEAKKTVTFAVYKGSKDVTSDCAFAIVTEDGGHIADATKIVVDSTTKQISVSSDCLATRTLEGSGLTIAYPQAYFYVKITYNGETMTSAVNITVDSSACIGGIVWDNKQFKSEYETFKTSSEGNITACMTAITQSATEIENRVSTTTYNSDLSKINSQFSEIIQTANKISSRVDTCETNIDGTKTDLSSQINQTATSIRQELTNELNTKASAELALQKDENGDLASVFNVKSNYMTFDTDNFKLTKDGTLTATNGIFKGSIKSDYLTVNDSTTNTLNADNVYIDSEDWLNWFTLKWDASQIGRTMRIANYTKDTVVLNHSEDGQFFITNGQQVTRISIAPFRCMVLHGLGHDGTFVAWCVENSYSYKESLPMYNMQYLAKGLVSFAGVNTTPNIYQKTYNGLIAVSRQGTGLYRLLLPESWATAYNPFDEVALVNKIGVMLTGFGYSKDAGKQDNPVKATVKGIGWTSTDKTQIYIDVWVSDDSTVNDGNFQFLIYDLGFFDY